MIAMIVSGVFAIIYGLASIVEALYNFLEVEQAKRAADIGWQTSSPREKFALSFIIGHGGFDSYKKELLLDLKSA